mmetsp:Transcript_7641/g.15167  ORF Transcript_7641/g.15167 Transcript_7641/m.15167 type:complete len:1059 (-) Transcript_7641:91-3267(-)
MGCTSSKAAQKTTTFEPKTTTPGTKTNRPLDKQKSREAASKNFSRDSKESDEDRWRMEPQRALDQFVKDDEDEGYFSGEGSMFDYFQDNEYVELRMMLDEPLGRSHFMAHVEHYFPEQMDLVRLWLLLHQYNHLKNVDPEHYTSDPERYMSAKNIYRHYFMISHSAKQQADDYRRRYIERPSNLEDDDLESEEGIDEDGSENGGRSTWSPSNANLTSDDPNISEELRKHLLECEKLMVPRICWDFPPRVIALIVQMRPVVEQAIYEAMKRFDGAEPESDRSKSPPRRRNRSSSIGLNSFVDLSPAALEASRSHKLRSHASSSSIIENAVQNSIPPMSAIPTVDGVNAENTVIKENEESIYVPTRESSNSLISAHAMNTCGIRKDSAASQDDVPPRLLFITIQHEIFKEMKPLYRHFKESGSDYETYKKSKRVRYNHVEVEDFEYIELLGKGGFGHVVHVKKRSTGAHLAMKVQAKDTLMETWGGKMQHVEIERDVLVAHRSFPFIVSLRYAFQNEKYAFLCLDLAEQGSLRNLLEDVPGWQLEPPQVRLYIAEIVLALEALHEHEILYRDLKPENVLLKNDGHIMLADMGLAGFYYQDKYTELAEGDEEPSDGEQNEAEDANKKNTTITTSTTTTNNNNNAEPEAKAAAADNINADAITTTNPEDTKAEVPPEATEESNSSDEAKSEEVADTKVVASETPSNDVTPKENGSNKMIETVTPDEATTPVSADDVAANIGPSASSNALNAEGMANGTGSGTPEGEGDGDSDANTTSSAPSRQGSTTTEVTNHPGTYRRLKTIKSHDTDCGTPLYRPPEMIRHEHYGEGVDWFMMGVLTYECLVGRLPFEPAQDKITDSGYVEIETDEQELKLLRRKLRIPEHLDEHTRSLLVGLLDLDQTTRLGVGPPEQNRDLASLKSHPFFIPLGGPLATECDWDKVLHKEYKPAYVPDQKTLEEKRKYPNFDALVKDWKKNAKKEARRFAKRKNKNPDYDIPVLTEGKKLDPKLERYFDNWDYIDPHSIALEKQAARTVSMRAKEKAKSNAILKLASKRKSLQASSPK